MLKRTIVPACLALAGLSSGWAAVDPILFPGDPILGGVYDFGSGFFVVGDGSGTANTNSWPGAESPNHVIDGVGQKYLNFAENYTGFIVQPYFNGGNGSVVTSMQLWTANDAPERDPMSYQLLGSNAPFDLFLETVFDMSQFEEISWGSLSLPETRNLGGNAALNNASSQTISFANLMGYKTYVLIFPTVKNGTTANSMQIAEVQFFGTPAFVNLEWTGGINGTWNVETTANWSAEGVPSTFSQMNGVMFNDSASITNVVVQNGGSPVRPAAAIFQNDFTNYTITGDAIESEGSVFFNGMGTVTINNAINFEGGTTVNSGTLIVGPSGSLGSGPFAVNNTSDFFPEVRVEFQSAQSIGTLSGTVTNQFAGNVAEIYLNGMLTIQQEVNGLFMGSIRGTGGLTKNGLGSLALTALNTYEGPTIVNEGVLRVAAPTDFSEGALPANQPVTVNGGGTLSLGTNNALGYSMGMVSSLTLNEGTVITDAGTYSMLPALILKGGTVTATDGGAFADGGLVNYILDGNVTTVASSVPSAIKGSNILLRNDPGQSGNSAPMVFNVARGTAESDLTISAIVRDKGAGLVKDGAGILTLENENTYTGSTVINDGTILVLDSKALGTGAVTIHDGATLALGAAAAVNNFDGFILNGGATLNSTSTAVTLTENLGNQARSAFTPNQVSIEDGFTAQFVYTSGGNRVADGITFTIQNSGPTALGAGGGSLGYVGIPNSASVQFNLYTGQADPQPVGTAYAVGTSGSYISTAPVNLASGNPIQVILEYDPVAQTMTEDLLDLVTGATYSNVFFGVDLVGAIGSNVGYVGFTGATGGAFAQQVVSNFRLHNFAQGVNLTNQITVPADSDVTLAVMPYGDRGSGSATLSGLLTIGANSTVTVESGSDAPGAISLSATQFTTIAGATTFEVLNNGSDEGRFALNGLIGVGSVSVTKTGDGTLVLGGALAYTGPTVVDEGTLQVSGSLLGGATTVNDGGTLTGNGTLAAVSIGSGGTLSPGDGLGTINTGPLTLGNGSKLDLQVGVSSIDLVKVSGAATLEGNIELNIRLLANPTDDVDVTIIDGTAPLIGYAEGARFTFGGNTLDEGAEFFVSNGGFNQIFRITYAADGGNDVVLTVVPEPGVVASLLGGLGLLVGLRRRR